MVLGSLLVAETLLVKCRQSRTQKYLEAENVSMSAVWRYYKVNDNNIAIPHCEIYKHGMARGGKGNATFNTKNMIQHLDNKHCGTYLFTCLPGILI